MGVSNLVGLAILITAGATLHASATHEIATAADAARALRPLAGPFAFALFAGGIVGTGLIAVPVLASSAAYALGEAWRWPIGLDRKPMQARAFYAAISAATLLGALTNWTSIKPMRALVWVAVINGVVAVPVMTLVMLMAMNPRILGAFRVTGTWLALGWTATGVMAVASAALLISAL
jgi:Mn2+/Fe2+ NRAMP family transporter